MRVKRKVNVALQNYKAWQHRDVVDKVMMVHNAEFPDLTVMPAKVFTPHYVTATSGVSHSAVTSNVAERGLK
jgi:hypothetical protein